jgi:hypothetical protein
MTMLAHVAGLPIEELAPAVATAAGVWLAALRLGHRRPVDRRRLLDRPVVYRPCGDDRIAIRPRRGENQ